MSKYVFVITHTVKRSDGVVHTDITGVADTLIGAELYARRFISEHFSVDMFFSPTGWGTSSTHEFAPIGLHGDTHTYSIAPAMKVNRNTSVRS